MRGPCLAVLLLACGGSQKPPPLAEVPINENTPSANNPPPGDDPAPVGDTSGALPVEGAHDAGPPDSGSSVKKPNTIGEADCRKVIKKYADFVSKGTSAADLESNPVYGQMLSQCQVETTKKQYTCAMASRTKTGWETCMK